ncbi:MAG: tetratricopeptide repeat protein [Muribaculaceae bacterium]
MNKIYNRTILCLLSLLFSIQILSYASPVDSLETVLLNHANIDTAKVNILNKLAYELYARDAKKAKLYVSQSQNIATKLNYAEGKAATLWINGLIALKNDKAIALKYFEKALHIAEQVKDQKGICTYLMAIGNVTQSLSDIKASDQAFSRALQIASTHNFNTIRIKLLYNISANLSNRGQYVEAIKNLQQVIECANEIGESRMLAMAYAKSASIFNLQGNNSLAMEYYLYALHAYEQKDDKQGIFFNLINIAGINFEQAEYNEALKNINQAHQIAKAANDSSMIAICLTNIGNVYHQMKRPDAINYLQKALHLVREKNAPQTINLLNSIGDIYIEQGKFSEAEKNLNEALDIAQKSNIKFACGEVLKTLGILCYTKKEYARSIDYANQALELGSKIKYRALKKDSYKLLADIYASSGNYKDAYINYVGFKNETDSIFAEKNVRKIALLESAYKYDKEKQILTVEKVNQQLKIKNQRNYIFFLIALTTLLFMLIYQLYRSNRLKKKALQLEIDKVNQELEYSQKEMVSATLKMVQKSESDAYSIKVLKEIEQNTNKEGEDSIRSLISYYKNKSAYTNWEEFELLFLKVNNDFYDKLNQRFPELTLNERKLCVFFKLNMTSKDIAQITFQSEEALKKARTRLRKKLGLDREDGLLSFIQSI